MLPEELLRKTRARQCFPLSGADTERRVFRQVNVRRTAGRAVITSCGTDDAAKDVAVTLIRERRIRWTRIHCESLATLSRSRPYRATCLWRSQWSGSRIPVRTIRGVALGSLRVTRGIRCGSRMNTGTPDRQRVLVIVSSSEPEPADPHLFGMADRNHGLPHEERGLLYSLLHDQSCRRPVTNFDESRPTAVSSCGGRTRYRGCLARIAAKRRGTSQGHRNTCGSAGAHAARPFR